MEFVKFREKVKERFDKMAKGDYLYRVNVNVWDTYLNNINDGIYKEARQHNCNYCNSFIKHYSSIVAFDKNGNRMSMFDVEGIPEMYVKTAKAMLDAVLAAPIVDRFLVTKDYLNNQPYESLAKIQTLYKLGMQNNQVLEYIKWEKPEPEKLKVITFNHFYVELPTKFVLGTDSLPTILNDFRNKHESLSKIIKEIGLAPAEIVLDMIGQTDEDGTYLIYRGEEYKPTIEAFIKILKEYEKVPNNKKDDWIWVKSDTAPRIRSTVIGTLLADIAEGKTLEAAAHSFGSKMEGYKKPKTFASKAMIKKAQETIYALGYSDSLERRFANVDDITINDLLYVNKDVKNKIYGDAFDVLIEDSASSIKLDTGKVKPISIEDFIGKILLKINKLEVFVEPKHSGNFVSLIAPIKDSKSMFSWGNNFSWVYANNDTDSSITESVSKLGGNIKGVLRFSIMWAENGKDNSDLDAWCVEPNENKIKYDRKRGYTGGELDIDIRNPSSHSFKGVVENIVWANNSKMINGVYKFMVHNFSNRGSAGFKAEIAFDDKVYSYTYNLPLPNNAVISVADVELNKGKLTIKHKLPVSTERESVWGAKLGNFYEVKAMSLSPNYWGKGIGNKHYMMFLKDVINPEQPSGFFSEYLNSELVTHRKALAMLGNLMRVEKSTDQLSGLGFSSTKKAELVVKTTGEIEGLFNIKF